MTRPNAAGRSHHTRRAAWTIGALATLMIAAACSPPPGQATCRETPGFICPVAGSGKAGAGAEREPAIQTELFQPVDVALRPGSGTVIVVDQLNHRVREIDADGFIQTIAGKGIFGDAVDGPALQVELANPSDVSFDHDGKLVVSAWQNFKLMRLDDDGRLVTFAGTGKRGFAGDGGPVSQAKFDLVANAVSAADGSYFVSDQGSQRVRHVDASGVVTTVAGTGEAGYGGDDGPAMLAKLQSPAGQSSSVASKIALAPDGALLIADSGNHRVRRVGADGIIRTIAGTGVAGFTGDGGPATSAQLSRPTDLAVADDGTIYVADTDNSCIRRIAPNGTIDTFAGRCGEPGFDGDDQLATAAQLQRPFGIALAANGDLYVADTMNHRVRIIVHSR